MTDERIELIDTLLTAQEERMAQGFITGSISVVDARYLLDHIAALEARLALLEDVATAARNCNASATYRGAYTDYCIPFEPIFMLREKLAALDKAGQGT